MSGRPSKGRVRICDDTHNIIGSNMSVRESHKKEMNKTKKKKLKKKQERIIVDF